MAIFKNEMEAKKMKRFNNKNLMPKILSILFALIMWIYVMDELNPRRTRDEQNIPVEFLNMQAIEQEGLVLKGEKDFTIRVRINGRIDEIYKIKRSQIQAKADLLGFKSGINNVPVEVSVPGDVEVDFNPKHIRVELEEIIGRRKPVEISVEGSPERGHVLGELQYDPTSVLVEGPESLVNSVDKVVGVIKLSEDFQSISQPVSLHPINSRGEQVANINLQPKQVMVNLPMDQLKTVAINPLVDVNPAEGYEISNIVIEPSTVTIRGQHEQIDNIKSINTEAITIDNLSSNLDREIRLDIPETGIDVDVGVVKLIITVEELSEKSFEISRDNIEFRNIPRELDIDKSQIPRLLELRILAKESVVGSLNNEDLKLVVDMEGLEEGNHTLEPVIEVPMGVERRAKRIQLIPKTIDIRLIEG